MRADHRVFGRIEFVFHDGHASFRLGTRVKGGAVESCHTVSRASEATPELFPANVATERGISTPQTAIDSLVCGDDRHCSRVAVDTEAGVLVTTDRREVHVPVASVKLHDVAEPQCPTL